MERKDLLLDAAEDIKKYRLIKLSSGDALHNTATSTDDPVGVSRIRAEEGELVTVWPLSTCGVIELEMASAISKGAEVYAAADGKVQALPSEAGTYRHIGVAMEAASGAGSIIGIFPFNYLSTETVTE